MSVQACNRADCDNVMCHNLILGSKFYICCQCLGELRELRDHLPDVLSMAEAEQIIMDFMHSTSTRAEATCGPGKEIFDSVLGLYDQGE